MSSMSLHRFCEVEFLTSTGVLTEKYDVLCIEDMVAWRMNAGIGYSQLSIREEGPELSELDQNRAKLVLTKSITEFNKSRRAA